LLRLILLCVLVAPSVASAYSVTLTGGSSGEVTRWHKPNLTYYLHPVGSADVVDGSDLQAVKAGWQQWNTISCSELNVTYAGDSNNLNIMSVGGPSNGKNEIAWIETNKWIYGQWVLGITNTSLNPATGEVSEADIGFNGYFNKWSTTGKAGTIDVLNVAAHEQGHFIGAQHVLGGWTPGNPPTMAPTADPNLKSQTLEAEDELAACYLYPKGEYTCSSDADCPFVVDDDQFGNEKYVLKITCESNGLCGGKSSQIPEGTKDYGEACASDFDCIDPYFCQQTGAGDGVCAKNCTSDAECGSGFTCFEYQNGGGGVCLPGGGGGSPVATKETGDQCSSPVECKSGLCVGGFGSTTAYCRNPCTPGSNDCGAGEECAQLSTGSKGACLPTEGGSATKGPGETCSSPAECVTGLCVGSGAGVSYKCREPCTPALNDCPAEHACVQLMGTAKGACFPSNKELGEQCAGDSDCISGHCLGVVGQDGFFCTQACTGDGGCPCGLGCTEFVGGQSFCTPNGVTACTPSGNPCEGAEECISQTCVSGVCRDPCQVTTGGCPPGNACKRYKQGSANGVCEPEGPTFSGEPCSQDGECQTLLCEQGVCSTPCDPATTVCGAGLACLQPEGATITICADAPEPVDTGADTGGDDTGPGVGDGVTGGVGDGPTGDATTGDVGAGAVGGGGSGGGGVEEPEEPGTCAAAGRSDAPLGPVALMLLLLGALMRRRTLSAQ